MPTAPAKSASFLMCVPSRSCGSRSVRPAAWNGPVPAPSSPRRHGQRYRTGDAVSDAVLALDQVGRARLELLADAAHQRTNVLAVGLGGVELEASRDLVPRHVRVLGVAQNVSGTVRDGAVRPRPVGRASLPSAGVQK